MQKLSIEVVDAHGNISSLHVERGTMVTAVLVLTHDAAKKAVDNLQAVATPFLRSILAPASEPPVNAEYPEPPEKEG